MLNLIPDLSLKNKSSFRKRDEISVKFENISLTKKIYDGIKARDVSQQ